MFSRPFTTIYLRGAAALIGVTYFWLFAAVASVGKDLVDEDIECIFIVSNFALIIELVFYFVLVFIAGRFRFVTIFIFAFAAFVNSTTLYFLPSLNSSQFSSIAIYLIATLVLVLYFRVFDLCIYKLPRSLAAGASVVVPFFSFFYMALSLGFIALPGPYLDANGDPVDTSISFQERPNIYFISFDGMVSEAIAKKYFDGLPLPYIDTLSEFDAAVVPNVFADMVATKFALPSVLLLGLDPRNRGPDAIVSGLKSSVLGEILAYNGYQRHFTMYYGYFGNRGGPHFDTYDTILPYNACAFANPDVKDLMFFGYCVIRRNYIHPGEKQLPVTSLPPDQYENYVLNKMRKLLAKQDVDEPFFFMEHILAPSHAPSNYAGTPEEREKYLDTRAYTSKLAADAMRSRLDLIRREDPTALIYIYGDHGAYLSNNLKFTDAPKFFVQDRYGTTGAVINGERCNSYIEAPPGQSFQTISRLALGLVQCLSGGKSPFSAAINYSEIRQITGEQSFEDFIFE